MGIFDFLKREDKTKLLLEKGAVVIDVRTPGEFKGGHVKGSINIPLDTITKEIARIKKMNKPVVACCASGMRSGSASIILKNNGIEACNGGSWGKVNRKINS